MYPNPHEHDDKTPICDACGEHMGILAMGALTLRGAYVYNAELGAVEFLLDPQTNIQFLEHTDMQGPGRHQLGCIPNTNYPVAVFHEDCLFDAFENRSLDDEDDLDEGDE